MSYLLSGGSRGLNPWIEATACQVVTVPPAGGSTTTTITHGTATGSSNIATRNHNLVSPDQRAEGSLESTEWRQYCPGCQRPLPQCLCDHLPASRIRLDTDVLVLQHPVEFRRKTISTVPLLKELF